MLESLMFFALGFLVACVLAVLLAPPLWRRAVRLTTRRIEATMPMTVADIQADKDELRAEFAIKLRQLELALEKAKDQAARNLVERNRNQVLARQYKDEVLKLRDEVAAQSSQTTVLQQNVSSRIPKLEEQYARAREAITAREGELEQLKHTLADQAKALTEAQRELKAQQRAAANQAAAAQKQQPADRPASALQVENQRLAAEMANLRKHVSSADKEALKALKAENKRIEAELRQLKRESEILDLELSPETTKTSPTSPGLASENELGDLRREMHVLADQIMASTEKSNARKPTPRGRKPKTTQKSTGRKPAAGKSTRKKQAAGKERKPPLSQGLREMADS